MCVLDVFYSPVLIKKKEDKQTEGQKKQSNFLKRI